MKPLISVIIPTYNRCHILRKSIDSVLCQTFVDFELLIVDDQSTDATKVLVEDISKQDHRVQYFLNPRKGGNAARNYGISKAEGKYIALNDDDDIWLPNKLERQMTFIKSIESDLFLLTCRFKKELANGNDIFYPSGKFNEGIVDCSLNLRNNNFGTPTFIFSRALLKHIGCFNESLVALQDWDIVLRACRLNALYYQKEVLVLVNDTENSVSENPRRKVIALLNHLRINADLYNSEGNSNDKGYLYYTVVLNFLKLKKLKSARSAKSASKHFIHWSIKMNMVYYKKLFKHIVLRVKN